jgi:peptide/nickel transport system substrate-binding protein
MSVTRPPFNDPRAREAINLALDRNAVANAYHPGDTANFNLFPKDSPYYDAKYDYAKQDKKRAQELFDELAAEGKKVEFEYITADQQVMVNCAQLVQSELMAYRNVSVKIKTETLAQFATDQRAGKYQMAPVYLFMINPIPQLEDLYATGGSLNTMGYSSPTVDAAFDELHTEGDPAKQKAAYGRIQEQVNKDLPIYWAGHGTFGFAVSKNLANVVPVNYGNAPLWGPLGYKA